MVEVDLFWYFNCEEIVVAIRSMGPFFKITIHSSLWLSWSLFIWPFTINTNPISISTIKLSHIRTWAQKYWYPIWDPNCTHALKFVPILFQAFQAYHTKGRSCSSSRALLLPITTMYLRGLIVKMVKFLWRMTNSDCQTNSFNEVRWRSPKSKTIQKVGSKKDWSHDPSINPFGTWCSFTRWCVYTLYEWNWSICRANES